MQQTNADSHSISTLSYERELSSLQNKIKDNQTSQSCEFKVKFQVMSIKMRKGKMWNNNLHKSTYIFCLVRSD